MPRVESLKEKQLSSEMVKRVFGCEKTPSWPDFPYYIQRHGLVADLDPFKKSGDHPRIFVINIKLLMFIIMAEPRRPEIPSWITSTPPSICIAKLIPFS